MQHVEAGTSDLELRPLVSYSVTVTDNSFTE